LPGASRACRLALALIGVTAILFLAIALWLTIIRRKGEQLSTLGYMRVGILTAPPTLLAAMIVLWLVSR